MPKRSTEQQRAWALQETEGIGHQAALRRIRAEGSGGDVAPATPNGAAIAVPYVLRPTVAEAKDDITAEELGVCALPANSGPELRARAEAMWRPAADPAAPCRCSGKCHHGTACPNNDDGCAGLLAHVDRRPGSLWGVTDWWDVYVCTGCDDNAEGSVELPEVPWGEHRQGAATVVYDGVRHPSFVDVEAPDEYADDDEMDW